MTHFPLNPRANGLVWLLAIGLCFPLSSNAQKMALGFRGGQSFSNYVNHNYSGVPVTGQVPVLILQNTTPVSGDVSGGYTNYYKTSFIEDMRLCLHAGLFLNMPLTQKWSIEPGLSYVQKGIRLHSTVKRHLPDLNVDQTIAYDNTIHTNYIVMPIVAKYNLGKRERVFLLGGIYNALAVRSRGVFHGATATPVLGTNNPTYNPGTNYSTNSEYWQRNDDLATKRYDMGITLGGGMQWPITGLISLGFDVRGNMGLLALSKASDAASYYGFNSNARNINIEAGVRFMYALKP